MAEKCRLCATRYISRGYHDPDEHCLWLGQDQVDPDRVETCARLAQVATFIEQKLPMDIRPWLVNIGMRLSGGERQRMRIARVLYHNPQVLILTSTSALDVDTERAVMDAIEPCLFENHCLDCPSVEHRLLNNVIRLYALKKA